MNMLQQLNGNKIQNYLSVAVNRSINIIFTMLCYAIINYSRRVTGLIYAQLVFVVILLVPQQPPYVGGLSVNVRNQTDQNQTDQCMLTVDNSIVYKHVGSLWIFPEDPCSLHTCEMHSNATQPTETVTKKQCNDIYCDIDSELRPKEGTCCGECVRTKCLFQNAIYTIGQTWQNPDDCSHLECVASEQGEASVIKYPRKCPPFAKDCPLELIYSNNCCQYCRKQARHDNIDLETGDDNDDIWTEDFYRRHPCARECKENETPKLCRYTFVVEWYETLSKACYDCPNNQTDCYRPHCIAADGVPRSITVVNRMMPGPTVEVCQNDIVQVDVKNNLLGESTTIHWHGMHMKETPYMDGVPHITQCPISPHSTFRYKFKAENTGTHFWHSHTGMQRGDGVFGAFIVNQPRSKDAHSHLYDFDLPEHKIIVQDWVHVPGISMFASHHHSRGDNKPPNILINGKGRFYNAILEQNKHEEEAFMENMQPKNETEEKLMDLQDDPIPANFSLNKLNTEEILLQPLVNNVVKNISTNENDIIRLAANITKHHAKRSAEIDIDLKLLPLKVFNVEHGYRYRFRIINAEFLNCPIQISIDNHTLTAINSDGYDFEAVDVGSIVTYAGERFDFIVNANQIIDNYWIRFKGLMDCDERFTSAFQVAILRYDGAPLEEPTAKLTYHHQPEGIELNVLNRGSGHFDSLTIAELNALPYYNNVPGIDRRVLKPTADYKFFVYYDFYRKDNPVFHPSKYYGVNATLHESNRLFTPQLNHISWKFPASALLSSRDSIDEKHFCNETSLQSEGIDCRHQFCQCQHVLQVPLGSIVELIIVDEGFTYDANHPFHLHGNAFRVIGLERLGKNVTIEHVKKLEGLGLLKRNMMEPPIKDTVTVPDGGYTILRFAAYNPGFWLFHCHIEFHAEIGMALVLKVGNNDDMPLAPKTFPTCHDFVREDGFESNNSTSKLFNNCWFSHLLYIIFVFFLSRVSL
ncbi:multicopper oxidase 1 isoform 1-T2 [Glossina fuscipes fuscipes]